MFTVNARNIADLLMKDFCHLPSTPVNARDIELKEHICGKYGTIYAVEGKSPGMNRWVKRDRISRPLTPF